MRAHLVVSIALTSLSLALSGCASAPNADGSPGSGIGAALKTGGLGCLGGAAVGLLVKGNIAAAAIGCGVGAVAGAAVGYAEQMQRELDYQKQAAQTLQQRLSVMSSNDKVAVMTHQAPDRDHPSHEIAVWDQTTLNLPAHDLARHSEPMLHLLQETNAIASKSDKPVHVDLYVHEKDEAWVRSVMDASIPDASTETYTIHVIQRGQTRLVLSPVPDLRKSHDVPAQPSAPASSFVVPR